MLDISFLPLSAHHIPLLRQWVREAHVAEWWQEPEDEEEFRSKYLRKLQEQSVKPYITTIDNQPIGYIQSYKAYGLGEGWWPNELPGTYGIDYYIGDPKSIGKGFGTMVLQKFVARLFEDEGVQALITDPKPQNMRAIRSYEKAGFQKVGLVNTPDGEAMLMSIKRQSGFPLSRE